MWVLLFHLKTEPDVLLCVACEDPVQAWRGSMILKPDVSGKIKFGYCPKISLLPPEAQMRRWNLVIPERRENA